MSLRLLALTCFVLLSQASLAQQSSRVTDSPDSVCGQGANLSGLIDKAQKRTLLEFSTWEPIQLVLASQEKAPAQLVSPTSLGFDLLMATLKNRSENTIVSYRVGWGYVLQNGMEFHTGALMSVPVGVKPGRRHHVPDQAIHLTPDAEQVIVFVAELTFSNGGHWTAKKKDLRAYTADLINSP